jgi:hypothetical protein
MDFASRVITGTGTGICLSTLAIVQPKREIVVRMANRLEGHAPILGGAVECPRHGLSEVHDGFFCAAAVGTRLS